MPGDTRSAVGLFLDVLFPGRCLLCGRWLSLDSGHAAPVCEECRRELSPITGERCMKCGIGLVSEHGTCTRCREADFAFESNRALFPHSGKARELLARFKFEGRRRCATLFADVAAAVIVAEHDLLPIVPVPPRAGRRKADAVELLARCLEHRHGRRVLRLLSRTGGAQQKSLDFTQRRENLRKRILMAPGALREGLLPSRVLLLDDVFTTGATLDACARTLREAGCATVCALTLTIEE
jgi:ComF family protein